MILVFMLPLVVHVIVMDPYSHFNDFELSKAFLFFFSFLVHASKRNILDC